MGTGPAGPHWRFNGKGNIMQDLSGKHAVRVYTLDGIKDGEADFDGTGPVHVRTLDGTVGVRVPRPVAYRKTRDGEEIYAC